jgi:hypothetical protein
MRNRYILFIIVLFYSFQSFSQLNYSFTAVQGTYTPVTGGTAPPMIQADGTYPTHDEGIANDIPIGFTFNYNDTNYTLIHANSNGFASFRQQLPIVNHAAEDYFSADIGYGPLAPANCRPLLVPLWDDLDLFSAADLKYATTGTAPNRVFTLEWGKEYFDITATDLNIAFQIKLYETTNVVEFSYHQLPGAIGAQPSAGIGISATATGPGNYLTLNNASASPVASSTVNTYTINTRPVEGQVYRFTPLNSFATDYFRSKQSGNWNSATAWESSADNINWHNATLTPDFRAASITVRGPHAITVTADVIVGKTDVVSGGVVTVQSGVIVTVR